MGMNYYLYEKGPCEYCGRKYKPLHIGKSSWGWCFSLHVFPREGIRTLSDWKKLWNRPGAYIEDEEGERVSILEMETVITKRDTFIDQSGKPMELTRHQINKTHCIAHGKGTWDYIIGEFS